MISRKPKRNYCYLPERFRSCSVDELGAIIVDRLEAVREYRRFLKSEESKQYPRIRAAVRLNKICAKNEVHWLNEARHLLLATGYKHFYEVPYP